jgi:P27 family predicted phage terminase small subunit
MKNSAPRPPKALSTPAKRWWSEIQNEFGIEDPGGILILTAAAEAFDRTRQADAMIKAEGLTTTDRFGQKKSHPAVNIARDARAQMLAAIKQLRLDLEPVRDGPGRPPGRLGG